MHTITSPATSSATLTMIAIDDLDEPTAPKPVYRPPNLDRALPPLPPPDVPPPPYEPSGPPPGYGDVHKRRDRLWGGAVVGFDLISSFVLLFLTLAQLTTSPASLSTAGVILPFVYVGVAVYGRIAISRIRCSATIFYTLFYTLRIIADIAGITLFISHQATAQGGQEGDGDKSRGYSPWIVEAGRIPVAGLRVAQYEEAGWCTGCAWRGGVWGGVLMIHIALGALLMIHSHTLCRSSEEQPSVVNQDPPPRAPMSTQQQMIHFDNNIFRPRPIVPAGGRTVEERVQAAEDDDDLRPLAEILAELEEGRRMAGVTARSGDTSA
ncbi:hypothetical protein SpCBS45565_g04010 [Spizellomyces sp. 'palustris']|nr:hypothetical protein SpCBS45565_g04010 [Spizellomyces sp. 'palustris']